jgi:hypothetical protein
LTLPLRVWAFAGCLCLLKAQLPPKRPAFRDVTSRSTFSYVTNNDFRDRKYFPQPMCGGVAVLDYDGDGLMDIFFTNGSRLPEMKKTDPSFYNALLRNKGDGTFEDMTARAHIAGEGIGYSFGVAAADYDNDGWTDLFVANAGRNTLYRNEGNGTFSDRSAESGLASKTADTLSIQGAWIDYDGDGLLDLVLSNYTIWTPQTDRRCVAKEVEMYCSPKTYASVPQRLYRNAGGGRFEDVTDASGFGKVSGKGMGVAIADFNADGRADVFIANDTERNLLFINRGDGSFEETALSTGVAFDDHGTTVSAMGADAKDFDNDGFVDVFYNNLMSQVWALFRNQNGKSFKYVTPATNLGNASRVFSGWSAGFIDYDNDGWKDIYSANGDVDNLVRNAAQHDSMFKNQAGRTFVDVSRDVGLASGRVGYQRGAAFADLNNDGFMDIVVTSLQQKPRILLNSGGTGAHWLLLHLRGSKSNRDAIGAKVKIVTAAGRTLFNHVTTSVGLISSSDPRVHFGLGNESQVSVVEVRWPSGTVQTMTDVTADRILRIEEAGSSRP